MEIYDLNKDNYLLWKQLIASKQIIFKVTTQMIPEKGHAYKQFCIIKFQLLRK